MKFAAATIGQIPHEYADSIQVLAKVTLAIAANFRLFPFHYCNLIYDDAFSASTCY